MTVCSFVGVILIARPEFLFGDHAASNPSEERATPVERLTSVASEGSCSRSDTNLTLFYSAALMGVLASTATCEPVATAHCISLTSRRSYGTPRDWKTSTHSPFSQFFCLTMCAWFYIRVCRTEIPSPKEPLNHIVG